MDFLEQLAQQIISDKHSDWSTVYVVLPSRRAGLYLKKHLATQIAKPFFPPHVITLSDFLDEFSEEEVADQAELLFLLYETYREINAHQFDSFDKFLKWGQLLLSDFNEVDRYMIDPKQLFTDLRNIKVQELEVEFWSFQEEELSASQINYLEFWKSLPLYHQHFSEKLKAHGKTYSGLQYRKVAENIQEILTKINSRYYYFAGFNAFSNSEQIIVKALLDENRAALIFDADAWYTNDGEHEAGLFFRKIRAKWGSVGFDWMDEYFKKHPKHIRLISVSGNVAQARTAASVLNELNSSKQINGTALVLADENLLLPVLNSLPKEMESVNITMGFPVKAGNYFQLLLIFVELQKQMAEDKIFMHALKEFIDHSDICNFLGEAYWPLKQDLAKKSHLILQRKDLIHLKGERTQQLMQLLITENAEVAHCVSSLEKLTALLAEHYVQKGDDPMSLEYIYYFIESLSKIKELLRRFPFIQDIKTLVNLIKQYIGKQSIDFFGEPLEGLQLMGMLETRALDFKNVIVLSVNENVLPKSKQEHSFILHEVKKLYGLPTYREKDAVFANHFYRLLQRASNVYLVYNSDQDALNGGEKSRFIQQLEFELPLCSPQSKIERFVAQLPSISLAHNNLKIEKTETILNRIKEHLKNGISPSAINTYLQCPKDFYYRYVLGIRESKNVSEVADSALLGTIIHAVFDVFYRPFIGKVLKKENLDEMLTRIESETRKQFSNEAEFANVDEGMSHLVYLVAVDFVRKYILHERERIIQGESITIIACEQTLTCEMLIEIENQMVPIRFKGKIDRVDRIGSTLRIIDYKTGSFLSSDIKIGNIDSLHTSGKNKAIQLLIYALFFEQECADASIELVSGIVPLKHKLPGFSPLLIDKSQAITTTILDEFKLEMQTVFSEMLDVNRPFVHDNTSQYCKLCDD